MKDKFIQELIDYEKKMNASLFDIFFPQKRTDVEIPIEIETKFKIFLEVSASPKLLSAGDKIKSVLILSEDKAKLRNVIFNLNAKTNYLITFEENKNLEHIKDLALMSGIYIVVVSKKAFRSGVFGVSNLTDDNPKMYTLKESDTIIYDRNLLKRNFFSNSMFNDKEIKEV